MSDYKTIDETLYEIEGLGIERKKKNPILALLFALAGVAIIIAAYSVESIRLNANLSSALLFTGFVIALVGVIKAITCFTGKGYPYYSSKGCKLRRHQFFYDQNMKERVRECVTKGNLETLGNIPVGETSAIMSVIYKTDDNDIAIAQVLEYVPHYYKPVTEILVFTKGELVDSNKLNNK